LIEVGIVNRWSSTIAASFSHFFYSSIFVETLTDDSLYYWERISLSSFDAFRELQLKPRKVILDSDENGYRIVDPLSKKIFRPTKKSRDDCKRYFLKEIELVQKTLGGTLLLPYSETPLYMQDGIFSLEFRIDNHQKGNE
jgi:hypothetical protein